MKTCANTGGAGMAKYTMPPPSEDYRKNWEDIFGKQPQSGSIDTKSDNSYNTDV